MSILITTIHNHANISKNASKEEQKDNNNGMNSNNTNAKDRHDDCHHREQVQLAQNVRNSRVLLRSFIGSSKRP